MPESPPALGLESGTVRVVDWNPEWPALFAAERERILRLAGQRGVALTLEHTGSTAVPGLAAKPIIDILAGIEDEAHRPAAIAALEAAGYTHRGEQGIPGRNFFRRGEPRSYHVHLTRIGSSFWDDHRTFRDWLREHPDAADAYARVKYELASLHPRDRERYIEGKTQFVLETLRTARGGRR